MNRKNLKKSKTFWRNSTNIELKRTEEAFISPWNPWIIPIEKWGIPGTFDKPIGSVRVLKPRPVSKPKRRLQWASKKSKNKLTALKKLWRKQREEEVVEVEPDYDNPRPGCSGLVRAACVQEVEEEESDNDDPRPGCSGSVRAASVQPEEEEVVEVEPDYDNPRPGCSGLGRAACVKEEEEEESDYDDPRPGWSGSVRAVSVQQEEEEEEEVEIEPDELWMFDRKGWLVDAFDVFRNPEIVADFLKAMRTASDSSDDSD